MSSNLTILYATQTGNAALVGQWTQAAANAYAVDARLAAFDEVDLPALQGDVLLIISTTGEGDMPDMAQTLWHSLHDRAPDLRALRFAVLALGDSLYDHYCKAGKDWDAKLADLGGVRLGERTDCDVEFEDTAQRWIAARLDALANEHGWEKRETAPSPVTPGHSRQHPLPLVLRARQTLTAANAIREVVHCELQTPPGTTWQPGALLHILPENPPELVDAALQILGARAADRVYWQGRNYALGDLLCREVELRLPGQEFLRALGMECPRGDVLECLRAGIVLDVQDAVDALEPIRARTYSVASIPDTLALTVGRVHFEKNGKHYAGIASNWLADIPPGTPIRGWLHDNPQFALPEDDATPMLMIATGTGIAPYRGFLQERARRHASGKHWLIFGDRHEQSDFLYRDEWLAWQRDGLLHKLTPAFSRDQKTKIYVQHRLHEHGAEVFQWLENGACLYVCGDARRMAADVDAALHEIVRKHGNMRAADAAAYLAKVKNDKRYRRDVY
ncbi:MAG: sulfite reductase flavoprotein subunit alpha [Cardiobacteriaceae bacterium]|nr:sulfite reductase flavoprotein subunit alpha [Cardiobacteriaceae bacterium]